MVLACAAAPLVGAGVYLMMSLFWSGDGGRPRCPRERALATPGRCWRRIQGTRPVVHRIPGRLAMRPAGIRRGGCSLDFRAGW